MIQAILTERILMQVCSACILNRYTNVLGVYEAPDFVFQGLEKNFTGGGESIAQTNRNSCQKRFIKLRLRNMMIPIAA